MLVSHLNSFIFLKSRKTASTSTEVFFQKYCIDPNKINQFNSLIKYNKNLLNLDNIGYVSEHGIIGSRGYKIQDEEHKWYHHKPAKELKKDIGETIFDSYLKICNIRNPYDLAVSMYEWKKSQSNIKETFNSFLLNEKWQNRLKSNIDIWSIDGKYDFEYIRFENLKEDISKILKKLNIKEEFIGLEHYKKSNRKSYRDYYNQKSIEIVSKIYENELEVFNYSF